MLYHTLSHAIFALRDPLQNIAASHFHVGASVGEPSYLEDRKTIGVVNSDFDKEICVSLVVVCTCPCITSLATFE